MPGRRRTRTFQNIETDREEMESLLQQMGRLRKQQDFETYASLVGLDYGSTPEEIRDATLMITKQMIDFHEATSGGAIKSQGAKLKARNEILKALIGLAGRAGSASATVQSAQKGAMGQLSGEMLKQSDINKRIEALNLSQNAEKDIQGFILNIQQTPPVGSGELAVQQAQHQKYQEILTKYPDELGLIAQHVQMNARPEVANALNEALSGTGIGNQVGAQLLAVQQEMQDIDAEMKDTMSAITQEIRRGGVSGGANLKDVLNTAAKMMPGLLSDDGTLQVDIDAMMKGVPVDPETGKPLPIVTLEAQLADLQNNTTAAGLRDALVSDPAFQDYMEDRGLTTVTGALKMLRKEYRTNYRDAKRRDRETMKAMFGGRLPRAERMKSRLEYMFIGGPEREEAPKEPAIPEGTSAAAQATEGSGAQEAARGAGKPKPKAAPVAAPEGVGQGVMDSLGAMNEALSGMMGSREREDRVKAAVVGTRESPGIMSSIGSAVGSAFKSGMEGMRGTLRQRMPDLNRPEGGTRDYRPDRGVPQYPMAETGPTAETGPMTDYMTDYTDSTRRDFVTDELQKKKKSKSRLP